MKDTVKIHVSNLHWALKKLNINGMLARGYKITELSFEDPHLTISIDGKFSDAPETISFPLIDTMPPDKPAEPSPSVGSTIIKEVEAGLPDPLANDPNMEAECRKAIDEGRFRPLSEVIAEKRAEIENSAPPTEKVRPSGRQQATADDILD